jgi:GGDEF domain-containing protein
VGVDITAARADPATNGERWDALTGLLGRAAFDEALAGEIARSGRYDHGFTVVRLSSPAADEHALKAVASRLRALLRASDVAARIGHGDLALLLLESDVHAGERVSQRLRDAAGEGFGFVSGSAHYPSDARAADELLRIADERAGSR